MGIPIQLSRGNEMEKVHVGMLGDSLVVEAGGEIQIKTGGRIRIEIGGAIESDGAAYIVTVPDNVTVEVDGDGKLAVVAGSIGDTHLDTATKALLAIFAAIPTTDPGDSVTIWNDTGVLKVAGVGA